MTTPLATPRIKRPPSQRPLRRITERVGLIVLILGILVIAILLIRPSLLTTVDPLSGSVNILEAPSTNHLFGTDRLGRDVFARTVYGAQPVLIASLAGVIMAAIAGIALGLIAGLAPRWISGVVMRVVDVLLALPTLLIALIMIATLGPGPRSIAVALGIAYTPSFARVVESSIRRLRAIEFVHAARLFGASGTRIAVRHLLPNLVTEVVVLASSALGWAILAATTLSFLNLGVQLPNADWGADLASGATSLSTSWWISIFPGLAITATILLANFTGDRLIVVLDPRNSSSRSKIRPFRGFRATRIPDSPASTEKGSTP